jgi:hypothetical protein
MDVREHMQVVDANNQHIGTVKSIEGDRINLVESDALDPRHPFFDRSQIAAVDENTIKLFQKVSAIPTRAFVSSGPASETGGK